MPNLWNNQDQQIPQTVFNTQPLFIPQYNQGGTNGVIQTPSTSTGGTFNTNGGVSQGTNNYQNAFTDYANKITQNPQYSLSDLTTNVSKPQFNYSSTPLPQVDFGNNPDFNSYSKIINDGANANKAYLDAQYNAQDNSLNSQYDQLNTKYNNNNIDLAHTKAQALSNADGAYTDAVRFNNQLYNDQNNQLFNRLSGAGMADSSAADKGFYGSSANRLAMNLGDNASKAYQTYSNTRANAESSYTQNYNTLKTNFEGEKQKIMDAKNMLPAEKAKAIFDIEQKAGQDLLNLKMQYDSAKAKAQAAAASTTTPTLDLSTSDGTVGTTTGKVEGAGTDMYVMPGTGQVVYPNPNGTGYIDATTRQPVQQTYAGPPVPLNGYTSNPQTQSASATVTLPIIGNSTKIIGGY